MSATESAGGRGNTGDHAPTRAREDEGGGAAGGSVTGIALKRGNICVFNYFFHGWTNGFESDRGNPVSFSVLFVFVIFCLMSNKQYIQNPFVRSVVKF